MDQCLQQTTRCPDSKSPTLRTFLTVGPARPPPRYRTCTQYTYVHAHSPCSSRLKSSWQSTRSFCDDVCVRSRGWSRAWKRKRGEVQEPVSWRDSPSGSIADGGCWLLPGRAAEHLHFTSSLSLESHLLKVLGVKKGSVRWEGY